MGPWSGLRRRATQARRGGRADSHPARPRPLAPVAAVRCFLFFISNFYRWCLDVCGSSRPGQTRICPATGGSVQYTPAAGRAASLAVQGPKTRTQQQPKMWLESRSCGGGGGAPVHILTGPGFTLSGGLWDCWLRFPQRVGGERTKKM